MAPHRLFCVPGCFRHWDADTPSAGTLHARGHLRGKSCGCAETFAARSAGMRGHAVAYLVACIFHGKPVAAPEQVRGGLFPENAQRHPARAVPAFPALRADARALHRHADGGANRGRPAARARGRRLGQRRCRSASSCRSAVTWRRSAMRACCRRSAPGRTRRSRSPWCNGPDRRCRSRSCGWTLIGDEATAAAFAAAVEARAAPAVRRRHLDQRRHRHARDAVSAEPVSRRAGASSTSRATAPTIAAAR